MGSPFRFSLRGKDRPYGFHLMGCLLAAKKQTMTANTEALTSMTTFSPLSQPTLRSVPGTLLLTVAGTTQTRTQNSG